LEDEKPREGHSASLERLIARAEKELQGAQNGQVEAASDAQSEGAA
jgi:hypothetical protein